MSGSMGVATWKKVAISLRQLVTEPAVQGRSSTRSNIHSTLSLTRRRLSIEHLGERRMLDAEPLYGPQWSGVAGPSETVLSSPMYQAAQVESGGVAADHLQFRSMAPAEPRPAEGGTEGTVLDDSCAALEIMLALLEGQRDMIQAQINEQTNPTMIAMLQQHLAGVEGSILDVLAQMTQCGCSGGCSNSSDGSSDGTDGSTDGSYGSTDSSSHSGSGGTSGSGSGSSGTGLGSSGTDATTGGTSGSDSTDASQSTSNTGSSSSGTESTGGTSGTSNTDTGSSDGSNGSTEGTSNTDWTGGTNSTDSTESTDSTDTTQGSTSGSTDSTTHGSTDSTSVRPILIQQRRLSRQAATEVHQTPRQVLEQRAIRSWNSGPMALLRQPEELRSLPSLPTKAASFTWE